MARFAHVTKGQTFVPNTVLGNTVRDFFNQSPSVSGRSTVKKTPSVRISVYNSTSAVISSGTAVSFPQNKKDSEWTIPCIPYEQDSTAWGIITSTLDPGEIGSCIICGPARVKISDGDGDYVQPNPTTPDLFIPSSTGVPIVFRKDGEAIINLGGGGGSAVQIPHQFTVTDSSTYNEDGTVKQLQVTVSEGVLNDVTYSATDVPLTVGIVKFWIYAIDGNFYALTHAFQSDYFSVLLCGIVEVADGKLSITQVNYRDYPYVPVCGAEYGAVTLAGTVSYADHVLTADYTVAVKGLLNNIAFDFPATAIPASENGVLLAYIKLLTVDNNTTAESGFEFSANGQPSQSVEWYQSMFQYTLTANTFKVLFRQQPVQMFTFTKLYLNAEESGA